MILIGNEFLGSWKMLLTMEMFIFLSPLYGLVFLTVANFQIHLFCILSVVEILLLRRVIKDDIEMKEE